SADKPVTIRLERLTSVLDEVEVVSTGYQTLPKERATGSFSKISSEVLERQVSSDILSRIDGNTSAVLFDKRDGFISSDRVSVRGRSTIFGNSAALIILDNFPYEGDINAIDPNEVESI